MERVLDRRRQFDERSKSFPMRAALPVKPPRSYSWNGATVLDQGSEGACVGFGWAHELIARPVVVPGVTNTTARTIYREAQKVDEWAGESYEGTSVLAGAKVVQRMGHMGGYRWGFSLDDLIMTLGYAGPVVLGLNWYTGMMTPVSGRISPTGVVEGGHCILAYGVSVTTRRIKLVNSWGADWGLDGRCWVTYDDMDFLLHAQGEQCVPVARLAI